MVRRRSNTLCQAFDDGGLTHARLADQHWIVLGTAAQDLHHTLELRIATNQRVELRVHGSWVRSRENSLSRDDSRLRCGCAFSCVVRATSPNARQPQSTLMQDFGGEAFFFAQKSQ